MTSSERVSKTIRVYEDLHNAVKEETSGTPVSIADFYQVALEDALQTYDVERGRLVKTPSSDETASKNNSSEIITPDDNSGEDFDHDSTATDDDVDVEESDEDEDEDESNLVPADRGTDWYESLQPGHDYTLDRDEHDWTDLRKSSKYRLPVLEGLVRDLADKRLGQVTKDDVIELVTRDMGMSTQSARNYWCELLRRDNGIRPHPLIDPRVTDRIGHLRCLVACEIDDDLEQFDAWVRAGDTNALPDKYRERLADNWHGLLGSELYRMTVRDVVYVDGEEYATSVVQALDGLTSAHPKATSNTFPGVARSHSCDHGWAAFYTIRLVLDEVVYPLVADDNSGFWEHVVQMFHSDEVSDEMAADYREYVGTLYGELRDVMSDVDGDVSDALNVLEIDSSVDELDEEEVREAYSEAVLDKHPDTPGDGVGDIAKMKAARDTLLEAV